MIGNSDGGWSLAQNANDITATRTGGAVPGGAARAVIDTAVTIDRASDLKIQNAAGEGADATGLDVSLGTLNVTGVYLSTNPEYEKNQCFVYSAAHRTVYHMKPTPATRRAM